ncbi:MAG TPA: ArsB/NhaD family transporter, partial [Cyanophyceae cyanobacterium]
WFHPDAIAIIPIRKVLCETPWQIILFLQGMSLLVIGVRNTGITAWLSQTLMGLSSWGLTLAATGTGFLAAVLSAMFNNLPTVLLNAQAIQQSTDIEPTVREAMVYANAIGCAMGAKITPLGSVSTLLCLNFLTRQGFRIRWIPYSCIAFILTIPILFISLLSLAIWLPWLIV